MFYIIFTRNSGCMNIVNWNVLGEDSRVPNPTSLSYAWEGAIEWLQLHPGTRASPNQLN